MKQVFAVSMLLLLTIGSKAQLYKITLQAPQYKSGIAFLTYHMGKNLNIEDSAAVNVKGIAIFTKKKKLPGGIYAIVLPGKTKTVDFLVDKEQIINIQIDTTDIFNKTIVTGSPANIQLQQYQKVTAQKGAIIENEKRAYATSTTKADSLAHEAGYNKATQELNDYRESIITKSPNSMMATLLNAMKDAKIPVAKPVTHEDSLANYYGYRTHFWDGVTFMDERVIRTPFFLPKLERYYRDLLVPDADSIIKEIDYQLLLARTCPEMYKFLLNWVTDEYINPKYMGQDKIFVHLYLKYHSQGLSPWLNTKQQDAVTRQAQMLIANLLGEKAADLEMVDSAGKARNLYSVNAEYTVVVFWDPTCGHCKEEVPRLDSVYKASWKAHGVKMYGVMSADTKDDLQKEWKKFIQEHHLEDWYHVYQTKEMEKSIADAQRAGYKQLYNVIQTPTVYLLDKEKRIMAKKLSWDQLNGILEVKWKSNTKKTN